MPWRLNCRLPVRFNEAAADDRGKRQCSHHPLLVTPESFNEAAADDRGKQRQDGGDGDGDDASMRPRPMTAENAGWRRMDGDRRRRFNEAAADDRGKQGWAPTGRGGNIPLQ